MVASTDHSVRHLHGVPPCALLLSLLLLPLVTGCGGCRSDQPPEDVQLDEKVKPKEDFELIRLLVLPSTLPNDEEADSPADATGGEDEQSSFDALSALTQTAVKPGHWVQVRHQLRANNFDFVGQLKTNSLDRQRAPVTLRNSPFRVVSARPTSLPKAQLKYVETPLFIPALVGGENRSVQIGSRLESRSGNRMIYFGERPTIRMSAHQYMFVVLSDNPEKYGYLKTLTTIRPPDLGEAEWDFMPGDYAVAFIDGEQPVPLPSNSLVWTTTAFVLWDDYDPDTLSSDQQTALIDWLHWGGRLIISGPKSLDRLRSSFLASYLPALAGRTVQVSDQQIREVDQFWSIHPPTSRRPQERYHLTVGAAPMEAVQLELLAGGALTESTGQLIAERRVGRGSIVLSAFSLTDRQWVNWPGFDSFFNSCLMRRSARIFFKHEGFAAVRWIGSGIRRDPFMTCGLKYFSRDANEADDELQLSARPKTLGFMSSPVSGAAGWTDFSAVATAARESLQPAAGIAVPDRFFVAKILGCYLVCLVPLNWLLFRMVGRVEWAWIAAPLIALLGGLAVVKLAQLDIGFVRARSELAVIELQQDYSRAHVTRYTGLYTSLSSSYSVEFEDPAALAIPFSTNPSPEQLRLQTSQDVEYRRDAKVGLSGFPVLSNSTGMIHAEQMIDVQGPLLLEGEDDQLELANHTSLGFTGSLLVHRVAENTCRVAILGQLPAGESLAVRFEGSGEIDGLLEYLGDHPTMAIADLVGELSLRQLANISLSWQQLEVGEYRFVGWNEDEVAGMFVRPKSNQSSFRMLAVGNVRYAPSRRVRPDRNLVDRFLPPPESPDDEGTRFPASSDDIAEPENDQDVE